LAHGDVIDPTSTFGLVFFARARIEDVGNGVDVQNITVPVAGIDDETTLLYILSSAGLAAGHRLLVTDDVGSCAINPLVEPDPVSPLPTQALVQKLVPVPPGGSPDFTTGGGVPGVCDDGTVPDAPEPPCKEPAAWDIPYWIPDPGIPGGDVPAIYVVNEWAPGLPLCAGGPFDVRNLPDGPACVAATAKDLLGNSATSRALAICIDKTGSSCAAFNPATVNCGPVCAATTYPPGQIIEM
jgi:hypothetical protein